MKYLVIAEKPSVALSISKVIGAYLGAGTGIERAFNHRSG